MTELRAGSATDVGLVRATNQDQLLVASPLFAVADGMGGHAAGEVAAAVAVRALGEALESSRDSSADGLVAAAKAANRAVWEQAQTDPDLRGMGTTLVAMALTRRDQHEALAIVNIGDSRLYCLRAGELEQLTSDHSLVAELVAGGEINQQEAEVHPRRNVLTRALGVDPEVPVDLLEVTPEPGDRFLLCSDGLYRELKDNQIEALLRRLADPGDAAHELVNEAKRRGGSDNITVVVVDVVDPEAGALPLDVEDRTKEAAAVPGVPGAAPVTATPKGRRRPRREARAQRRPEARPVTVRVIGFLVLLLAILGAAAAAITWYARDSYFVGLQGNSLTIFQGRPGGVLWLGPTVATRTAVTTATVQSSEVPQLRAGQVEPSMTAARQYIGRLQAEYQRDLAASQPLIVPTTAPTTTVPTTTVPPATGAAG